MGIIKDCETIVIPSLYLIVPMKCRLLSCFIATALLAAPTLLPAAITVTGVADKAYYLNSVSFTITNEAGFNFAATMDDIAISPTGSIVENRFGYHTLVVTKTPIAGGASETRTVRFIIKDGSRGGSSNTYPEAGLGRWTPLRSVDAPAAALNATTLTVLVPAVLPADFPLPVMGRLTDGTITVPKLMGTVSLSGAAGPTPFRLYRGAGSKVVKSPATAGTHELKFTVVSQTITKSLQVAAAPTWQALSGAAGGLSFAAGSFIDMTGNVTVAAGSTLTIGAGSVVRCAQGVEFDAQGIIKLEGTQENPIVFAPATGAVWGGIWVHGTQARLEARFTMLTGGGANPSWITQKGMHSHRANQPIITWTDSATGFVDDCVIIDNPSGQVFHGEDSEVAADHFKIRRCHLQRAISGGQIADCFMVWDSNHLVELPVDETNYTSADANDDFDGLYVSGGLTTISNSVIGWTKDDGMDSGSGNTSYVTMTDCWFESCYHEAIAWSEGGTRSLRNTATLNSGQGLECGFTGQGAGTPAIDARGLYSTGNLNGIRYGDNYDWAYSGKFDVHDSLSIFNNDDVFGRHWGNFVGASTKLWDYVGNVRTSNAYMHLEALPAQSWGPTIVSIPQAEHPTIPVWDPVGTPSQLDLLTPFVSVPGQPSGCGIAQEGRQFARSAYGGSVAVRLDRPMNVTRNIPWKVMGKSTLDSPSETVLANGTLSMVAGREAASIALPALAGNAATFAVLTLILEDSAGCVCTGQRSVMWADLNFPAPPLAPTPLTLISRGATGWKYLAQATAAPTDWATTAFNDTAWPSGVAPLKTAESALAGTDVPGNPANSSLPYNTVYFRKSFTVADRSLFESLTINCMRDDGVVIHLNGQEIRRSNMPATGTVGYNTAASGTPATESEYVALTAIPLTNLLNGTNVLAVEVHQYPITGTPLLTTSSDMRLDLDLMGVFPTPAAPVAASTAVVGNLLHLLWSDPTAVLQTNPNLDGSWQDWSEAKSPYPIVPEANRMFYRLRKP